MLSEKTVNTDVSCPLSVILYVIVRSITSPFRFGAQNEAAIFICRVFACLFFFVLRQFSHIL